MSKTSTTSLPASPARTLRRTIALGGLGAFLAIAGGPSCTEVQSSGHAVTVFTLPPAPSRNPSPDLNSDDYFDQILATDAALPTQACMPGTKPVASKPSSRNPVVSRNWDELLQSIAATEPTPGAQAYELFNPPAAPASVYSVRPTYNKSSNPASAAKPAPAVAQTKPVEHVDPKPVEPATDTTVAATTTTDTKPMPVEPTPEPDHTVAATTTTTAPDTKPQTVEPSTVAVKPTPEPVAQPKPVETTPVAVSKPTPMPQTAARIQLPAAFGLFALAMQFATLATFLATLALAFIFSKSTDRAGVTARSFTLRTRFTLAFGFLATVALFACTYAAASVATMTGVLQIAGCAVGSVVAAVGICFWLIRSTAQPIARINSTIRALATGDMLQKPINSTTRDEFGELARSVDRLSSTMRDALTELAISSTEVSGAANQIVSGVQNMTAAATDVAKQCAEASRAAAEVSRDANDGHGAIKQTAEGISTLGQIASTHAAGMQSIQSHSQQVADLVKVIDDLAERTSLVALNASIEASRSGPASRALGVLADEARQLSEKAQSAAAEAAQTVQSLDAQARAACEKVAGSESQIRQGAAVASKASADYETISSRTFTVAGVVQKAGLAAEGFGNNAAVSAAAAAQLAARSNHMMSVMKRFKLDTAKLNPINNRSSGQPVEQPVPAAV
jgi:methyl-accepting chemotaxis protein